MLTPLFLTWQYIELERRDRSQLDFLSIDAVTAKNPQLSYREKCTLT